MQLKYNLRLTCNCFRWTATLCCELLCAVLKQRESFSVNLNKTVVMNTCSHVIVLASSSMVGEQKHAVESTVLVICSFRSSLSFC